MNSLFRGHTLGWGLVLIAVLASYLFLSQRFASLPDLGVFLGPDLAVRAVSVEREPSSVGPVFQRGDRFVAIHRQAVQDLRDMRAILPHFMKEVSQRELSDSSAGGARQLDYQIVRPLHHFNVVLQGDWTDPIELPAGIEANDRLVQIDERPLPGKVGTEGLRSIVTSRPEAILGFERQNAVFSGQIVVRDVSLNFGIPFVFGLALLIILALWHFYDEKLHPLSALAVACETLCYAWLCLLVFEYQWLMADYAMASGVAVALVMMRPLAIFSRDRSSSEIPVAGIIALILGGLASASIIVLLYGELIANAERALHIAAIITALFIVYELIVTGFEKGSSIHLGEKSGHLAGMLLLGGVACMVAVFYEPIVFEEDRWRWFAVLIPAFVWFGDVLYCQSVSTPVGGEWLEKRARHDVILKYMHALSASIPNAEIEVVVCSDAQGVIFYFDEEGLKCVEAPQTVYDAISILVGENVHIPLPEGSEWQAHPMDGIAKSLGWVLALPLLPPQTGIQIAGVTLVVTARKTHSAVGVTDYPSPDVVNALRADTTHLEWSSLVVEGVSAIASTKSEQSQSNRKLENGALESINDDESPTRHVSAPEFDEAKGEIQRLNDELLVSNELQEYRRRALVLSRPDMEASRRLLEKELIAGLEYLLETDEPIVLGGAQGAGKAFVAWAIHLMDAQRQQWYYSYDCARRTSVQWLADLVGDEHQEGHETPVVMRACQNGTLLIENCQLLDDELLLEFSDQAAKHDVRLLMAFCDRHAEERSVLQGRAEKLVERLAHREMIIPRFHRRRSIMSAVIEHFLVCAAIKQNKDVRGLTQEALEALMQREFEGELMELHHVIERAVARAEGGFIDREHVC